ncbi:MAG: hypothetical protein P8105_04230, partial [Dehalococcoidia bacterium]
KLSELESKVKESLKEGYLACPVAWKIAKDEGVPKIAVGEIADRLGIRVTDCQLGCFRVEKTLYDNPDHEYIHGEIIVELEKLIANNELTCPKVFELARKYKVKPLDIANEVSARGLKFLECQLGCF